MIIEYGKDTEDQLRHRSVEQSSYVSKNCNPGSKVNHSVTSESIENDVVKPTTR